MATESKRIYLDTNILAYVVNLLRQFLLQTRDFARRFLNPRPETQHSRNP